ncbi:MAG: PAS domain S-box protein, partial [Actinomycetota bacterium]
MHENHALERRRRTGAGHPSIRVALAFVLVGFVWIIVTDLVLVGIFHSGWEEIWPKSVNQAVFVMFATAALFLLVRRHGRQLEASHAASRLSEEALRRSEWRYRSLVERVPGVVWLNEVDRDDPTRTHCVYAGPQLEDLLGYSPEEWMADDDLWQRVIHPDDLPGVLEENHLADAKGNLSMEYRAFRRDGGIVWIHDEAVLVQAGEDRPAYWQGVMVDITAQRVQDMALHDLTESLSGVFNASPLALVVLEPDGIVRHWNPAAEGMFGWTAREVVGRPLPYVPEHKKEEFEELIRRELAGESVAGFETTRIRKDGSPIEVSLSVASLRDADGGIAGMLGVVEDISERLAAHESLAERAGQLERLAQERQQMLHRIVRAQEEERERVALELHDGLGQVLTSISLFASDLEHEVPAEAKPRA